MNKMIRTYVSSIHIYNICCTYGRGQRAASKKKDIKHAQCDFIHFIYIFINKIYETYQPTLCEYIFIYIVVCELI